MTVALKTIFRIAIIAIASLALTLIVGTVVGGLAAFEALVILLLSLAAVAFALQRFFPTRA